MRFLGHLFLSLIISSLIIFVDHLTNSDFLNNFFDNQLIPTLASLVGFNVAAVIFLIGRLDMVEIKNEKAGIFNNTRKEIKQHSIYFILIDFIIIFLLLIFKIDSKDLVDNISKIKFFIFNTLILALFLLIIFSIFEIMKATFRLNEKHQ